MTTLVRVPDAVTDDQAILRSDVLPTGWFGARLAELSPGDTVLVLGAGVVGQFAAPRLSGESAAGCMPAVRRGTPRLLVQCAVCQPHQLSPAPGGKAISAKTVLITGATSGIGAHTALLLLDRGHRVAVTGRTRTSSTGQAGLSGCWASWPTRPTGGTARLP